jgi:hypothetical protein
VRKGFARVGIFLFVVVNVETVENDGRVLRDIVHPIVYKVLSRIVRHPHPEW